MYDALRLLGKEAAVSINQRVVIVAVDCIRVFVEYLEALNVLTATAAFQGGWGWRIVYHFPSPFEPMRSVLAFINILAPRRVQVTL